MMHLSLSIILVGKIYLNKFQKYSIYSIKKNIEKINNQNITITFFISTEEKFKKNINFLIKKEFKEFNYNLVFDYDLKKIPYDKITYQNIGNIQSSHLIKSKEIKSKYMIFLYSDIIYSNNAFLYSLKILKSNRKIYAVGSFALALNLNKKFKFFFEKLLNNQNYLNFFFKNFFNLTSNFHKKFIYNNNLNIRSNFICFKKKEGLLVKSQHYHPVIIQINKITNNKILTLDSSFYEFFTSSNHIYIEKNLRNLSIFSFDSINSARNNTYNINKNIFVEKKDIKKFNFLDLYLNVVKNKKNYQFFLNNYVYLSFSKNLKINSLNNFINFILQKKIIKIRYIIANKYHSTLNQIYKINKKEFFLFFLKNYLSYNNFANNIYTRNIINFITKIGVINPLKAKIKNDLFNFYFLLIMTYSFFNKIKFLSRFILKKII
jgi:hypothetical protein